MHGQFCWYELTTPDVEASKRFYSRFTGWGTQAFDKNYQMFTTGGIPVAGVFRLNDEMRSNGVPPNWMAYVEADNVDESVAKAKSLGAKLLAGPDDIPNTGRFAVMRDPQGATFGIYRSSRQSGGWDGKNIVGRFSWHELMTSDHVKAFEFYSALFGWNRTTSMDMGGGNMYQLYGQGEAQYGGMFNKMPGMESMSPFWLMYIHVDDVGKAMEIATKNGAFVQRERMEIPGGGTIAILGDPQGAGFALHDTRSMPSAAAATVANVGAAVKKAASNVAKAVTKAVKKVRKTAAKKAKAPARKAKAKAPARKAKAKAKAPARRAKAKSRPRAKAKSAPRKQAARRAAPKKKARSRARAKK